TFDVALGQYLDGAFHIHLDEMWNGRPDFFAHGAVGRDGGHNHDHTVAGKQLADESDAPDVDVAVLFAEAEPFGEVRADHVAVEQLDLCAVGAQARFDDIGDGALAGPGEPREPKDKALMHAGFPEPLRAARRRSAALSRRR